MVGERGIRWRGFAADGDGQTGDVGQTRERFVDWWGRAMDGDKIWIFWIFFESVGRGGGAGVGELWLMRWGGRVGRGRRLGAFGGKGGMCVRWGRWWGGGLGEKKRCDLMSNANARRVYSYESSASAVDVMRAR